MFVDDFAGRVAGLRGFFERIPNELTVVLRLRACMAQFAHRTSGGNELGDNRIAVSRYYHAMQLLEGGWMGGGLAEIIIHLHAVIMGLESSHFRTNHIALQARNANLQYPKRIGPQEIAPSLADLDGLIFNNDQFDALTKAILTYYEVLHIHPFSDGNGRVARLLLGHMLKEYLRVPVIVDLTLVMRSDFRRYNGLLIIGRSPETYREWVSFFHGLLSAELQHALRIASAVAFLDSAQQERLRGIVDGSLGKINAGQNVDEYLAMELATSAPAIANLLTSILT